ncbi:MAG TPA: hypothetical protein VFL62_00305 [Bradyrhizobium sp.]|uniref:hypothetical protein n=1 Tax=Bradyrhizobium sp. TaxID=376 RepID=UPI002D7FDB43|nr:hypothetical protein [Bradyrhizobium sp.]HET7884639.1 hypothetical protein [Bradyrhizobium sp.]
MSDQAAEQPSSEQGSLNSGVSHPAEAASEPVAAAAAEPGVAAEAAVSEQSVPEPSLSEPSISEPTREPPKVEAVKAEASAPAPKAEADSEKISHVPAKVIVMPRGERAWTDHDIHVEADEKPGLQSVFGKRRIAAVAAMVAMATVAGAFGGGFATATFMHRGGDVAADAGQNSSRASLEASLSRIDADIQALKTGLDHTSKLGMSQFNKTTDRLDKLERAQAEPAAKLAKLSEVVDRLRAAPAASPVAATAAAATSSVSKETTGSIPPAQQQALAVPSAPKTEAKLDAKPEVGRLPTVEGWVLRDVGYGGAVIDGRRGTFEVYAGDMIPGLGRVDAIRRQDGRWVVVTTRGLIVAR